MTWKARLYASLPHILVLLGALGVAVTNEAWVAVIALSGAWLLPSPVNVSRETLEPEYTRGKMIPDRGITVNAKPAPTRCPYVHGAAESCQPECWTQD